MNKRLLTLVVLGFVITGCKTYYEPDIDNTRDKALMLIPGTPGPDHICPKEGDFRDWRMFVYPKNVTVNITYVIGDPSPPHNVHGTLILYDKLGNELKRLVVVPGRRVYEIIFPAVKQQEPYYLLFEAKSGCSGYLITCSVKAQDPCDRCGPGTVCCRPTGECCGPGTRCVDGRCVPTNECNPPCLRGQECREGVCVWPCGHRCRRGYVCDARIHRCVRIRPRVHRHRPKPKPKPVVSKCPAGQVFDKATGQCRNMTQVRTVKAHVLRIYSDNQGVKVVVDKGYLNGIRKGYKATIGGYTLVVIDTSGTRCTLGSSRLSPETLKGATSAVIYLK